MRYFLKDQNIYLDRHRNSFEDVPELHPLLLIDLLRSLGLKDWSWVSSWTERGRNRFSGHSASNSIERKTVVHRNDMHVKLYLSVIRESIKGHWSVYTFTSITILIDIIEAQSVECWYRACVVINVIGSSPGILDNFCQCKYYLELKVLALL